MHTQPPAWCDWQIFRGNEAVCANACQGQPPPQRSQRREVREDPGRLLEESFFWELRPEGGSEIPGKHQRRELRRFSMLQKPPVLVSNLIVLHEGVCRGNLQHALRPDRVGDGAKPCDAPECCREGGSARTALRPRGNREPNCGGCRAPRTKSRTPRRVLGRQRSHPTLS